MRPVREVVEAIDRHQWITQLSILVWEVHTLSWDKGEKLKLLKGVLAVMPVRGEMVH